MEDWEKKRIDDNFFDLLSAIQCGTTLLVNLFSRKLLNEEEMDRIVSYGWNDDEDRNVAMRDEKFIKRMEPLNVNKVQDLLTVLKTRKHAFYELKLALRDLRQSGACVILEPCCGKESWDGIGSIMWDINHLRGGNGSSFEIYGGRMKHGNDIAVRKSRVSQFPDSSCYLDGDLIKRLTPAHSNLVNYFCSEIRAGFIYMAYEKCTFSLENRAGLDFLGSCLLRWRVLHDTMKGLDFLHSNLIIHKNVKPANILLIVRKDTLVCVKLHYGFYSPHRQETIWASPEQLQKNQELTLATDIFSTGCVFYYTMTSEHHPFGSTPERTGNILKGEKNLQLGSLSSPGLQDTICLIESMIEHKPKDRLLSTQVLKKTKEIFKKYKIMGNT